MKIEHVAIWTTALDRMKRFYETYFNASADPRYENEKKRFSSYFLIFPTGARLEIMSRPDVQSRTGATDAPTIGLAHFAISVGSEEKVDELTRRLVVDGYKCLDGPRRTGDGYYESVILDPDGNRVEITV